MQQASLGDLWIQQHQNTVAVFALLGTLTTNPCRCQRILENTVQTRPHPNPSRVAPIQAAESLDVECQDAPMFWFCAHQPTCLPGGTFTCSTVRRKASPNLRRLRISGLGNRGRFNVAMRECVQPHPGVASWTKALLTVYPLGTCSHGF